MTNSAIDTLPAEQLDQLIGFYIAILGRTPDTEGLNHWAGEVAAGFTLDQVGTHMWNSAETRFFYPSDMPTRTIVADIYRNVLDREPDEEGLDFWTGIWQSQGPAHTIQEMIHAVTRYTGDSPDAVHGQQVFEQKMDVANYFISLNLNNPAVGRSAVELCDGTVEGLAAGKLLVDICAKSGALYESYQHIAGLYVGILGRAPTEGELKHWTDQGNVTSLDQIATVADALLEPSKSNHPLIWGLDSFFVKQAYITFGGYPGDADGMAFWTAELANDAMTRGEVVAKFAYTLLHTDLSTLGDMYESGRITADERQDAVNRINLFTNKVDVAVTYALQTGGAGNFTKTPDWLDWQNSEVNYITTFEAIADITAGLQEKRSVLQVLGNDTLPIEDLIHALNSENWTSSGVYRVTTNGGTGPMVFDDFPSGGILEQTGGFQYDALVNVTNAISNPNDEFRLEFSKLLNNVGTLTINNVETIIFHTAHGTRHLGYISVSTPKLVAPETEELHLMGYHGVDLFASSLPLLTLLDGSGVSEGGIHYRSQLTSGDITLVGSGGPDYLSASPDLVGHALIVGNDDSDALGGGMGDDSLDGGNGNDYLRGGKGDDHLNGGEGDDRLTGGEGADTLSGGGGGDEFFIAFDDSTAGLADIILDFDKSQSDVLSFYPDLSHDNSHGFDDWVRLSPNLITASGDGIQQHINNVANTTDNEVGFVFDPTSHMLYGDLDGDGAIDMQIALLGVTTLPDTAIKIRNDHLINIYSGSGVVNQSVSGDANVVEGYSNDVFGSP